MADYTFLPQAYLQGKFIPFTEAKISVATHALHYGTAAFGGMRVIPSHEKPGELLLFRLDAHCERLSRSAKYLLYDLPPQHIKEVILEFLKLNKPTNPIYLRPLAYTATLGITPRLHESEKDFLLYGLELGDYLAGTGVRCCFSSWMRQMDASLPLRGKITGAYITSSLAKSEAVARGYDEGILLNSQGKVCEGTGMNIFLVRKGEIITPSVDQDILEGITRDSVITVARDLGYIVSERAVDKSELLIADEVFLTGSAAKVTSVNGVENYDLPTQHPVADAIKAKFAAIVEGREQKYEDWITRLTI